MPRTRRAQRRWWWPAAKTTWTSWTRWFGAVATWRRKIEAETRLCATRCRLWWQETRDHQTQSFPGWWRRFRRSGSVWANTCRYFNRRRHVSHVFFTIEGRFYKKIFSFTQKTFAFIEKGHRVWKTCSVERRRFVRRTRARLGLRH